MWGSWSCLGVHGHACGVVCVRMTMCGISMGFEHSWDVRLSFLTAAIGPLFVWRAPPTKDRQDLEFGIMDH